MQPVETAIALSFLLGLATVLLAVRRIPQPLMPAWSILRAAAQLAVLSVILTGIISDLRWAAAALVVMFGAAVWTVSRRIGHTRADIRIIIIALAIGAITPLTVVFAAHAVEFTGRYLLAVGGIVLGGVMSISTLAGRHFNENLVSRSGEVEAWLALGATPRQAVHDIGTQAVHHALIPTMDQTRTTGLVALPGAFVGAIFGGASVIEAGVFQLVVLVSILTAVVITAILLTHGLGGIRVPVLRMSTSEPHPATDAG